MAWNDRQLVETDTFDASIDSDWTTVNTASYDPPVWATGGVVENTTSGNENLMHSSGPTYDADQYSVVTCARNQVASTYVAAAVRMQADGAHYGAMSDPWTAAETIYVWNSVGEYTLLDTEFAGWALNTAGDTVEIEAEGNVIRGGRNGTELTSVIDNTLANGDPGVHLYAEAGVMDATAFAGGDISLADPDVSLLPSASLTVTANAPQAIATEGEYSLLPAASLTVSPQAPQAVTTENNICEAASASMVLTTYSPLAITPDGPVGSLNCTTPAALNDLFDSRAEVPLPADGVGINFAGDATIEMWIAPSSNPNDNDDSPVTEGNGYDVAGNIILDRDIAFQSTGHILGISSGVFYFTCDTAVAQATRVGTTDLRDGNWHHVAVCRNATTGLIELFVDGNREDSATGPTGSLAHPDDLTHSTACGASGTADCVNSDPYLVLGCEKHELQQNGYIGLLTCLRISDNIRYSGATYTVPSGPFVDDANTLGLYQMREGSGPTIADESGNGQTMTLVPDANGTPSWSTSSPFAGEIATLPSASLTVTPSAPQAVTTEANLSALPSASLTVTPSAPTVNDGAAAAFQMSPSPNINDAGEATTAQLTPPSGKTTGNFGGGRIQDTLNQTPSLDPTADQYLELEWCIRATVEAAQGTAYEFRVVRDGVVVDTLSAIPQWTVSDSEIAILPAASITLSANVPQAVTTENHFSVLPSAVVVLAAQAPQVVTTENHFSVLPSASITIAPNAPQAVTTEADYSVLPSASISLTSYVPQAITSEGEVSLLPSAAIGLTPYAPLAITTEANYAVLASASLLIAPSAPEAVTSEGEVSLLPSVSLSVAPWAPQIVTTEQDYSQLPNAALLTVSFAPEAVTSEGNISTLPSAALGLAPSVPDAVTTEANFSELPSAALAIAPNAPEAVTLEGEISQLPGQAITLSANAPTVIATEANYSQLPSAAVALAAQVPQAITAEANFAQLPSASLAIAPRVPEAISTEGETVLLPSVSLNLATQAPVFETTEANISALPSAAVTLSANAPTFEFFDPNTAITGTALLTVTANAPQAVTSERHLSTLPVVALNLAPRVPQAVTTEGHIAEMQVASITIVAQVPTVFVPGNELAGYDDPDFIDLTDPHEFILIR